MLTMRSAADDVRMTCACADDVQVRMTCVDDMHVRTMCTCGRRIEQLCIKLTGLLLVFVRVEKTCWERLLHPTKSASPPLVFGRVY